MLFPHCVCVHIAPRGQYHWFLYCLSCVEVKSLADDRVRTGVCKLLSNLCCYELLSTSGFLRFDITMGYLNAQSIQYNRIVKVKESPPPRGVSWTRVLAMRVCVTK